MEACAPLQAAARNLRHTADLGPPRRSSIGSSSSPQWSPSSSTGSQQIVEAAWHRQLLQDAEDAALDSAEPTVELSPVAGPADSAALPHELARACAVLGRELGRLERNALWAEALLLS
mmetsp:Transcript_33454/g.77714  ORF Transcript_33454/g.77714 Transcript_33454/m.77714 type:complete len:118 (+) Transcript_33454:77-430(+)|eukprot:CAMPEP_0171107620 /NCGR_PEP_ID=MMETSP0766_2-20121228/67212_1 /TAXON_ID=439317 /ORGANISM="Gambierdiscus australes, Strain CAWD 149" /LENGTH=117 /DNA_ID=CAMNT_0011568979 /DNA_START=31 /DNA_END=384 /DNA_ORIENTATION=+